MERPPEDANRFAEALKKGPAEESSSRAPERDSGAKPSLDPRNLFQRPESADHHEAQSHSSLSDLADQSTIPREAVDADGPLTVDQDGEPLTGRDGDLAAGEDSNPLVGRDSESAGGDDGQPLGGQDSGAFAGEDDKPPVVQDDTASADQDSPSLVGQDSRSQVAREGQPAIDRDARPPADSADLIRGQMSAPPQQDMAARPAGPSDDTGSSLTDTAAEPLLTGEDLARLANQAAAPHDRPLTDASELFRGRMPPAPPSEETASAAPPQTESAPTNPTDGDEPVSREQMRQVAEEEDSDDDEEEDPKAPVVSADVILNSMELQTPPIEQVVAPPAPRAESTLSEMVREVADRILVGESTETGQAEVRIRLKDDVLGGTEILLTEDGGAYQITFVAANKDIENFLAEREEEITTALGERLDRDIQIVVMDRDTSLNQQSDDRGERQQGQQGQQGQPDDGRSRNQRSVQDERER